MRAILSGAVLALLWVLFPSVVAVVAVVVVAAVVKAVPAALLLSLVVRTVLPRIRGWAR
ncbi:hypothetical protein OG426_19395 [Streptomyces canus]|uniref:hypothetical protein n=1 Tax=Streptomyces canus TaxID=58343 RepID=UPI003866F526|nr:hypothetical protein OG426_19395 [Streptomyces canus]